MGLPTPSATSPPDPLSNKWRGGIAVLPPFPLSVRERVAAGRVRGNAGRGTQQVQSPPMPETPTAVQPAPRRKNRSGARQLWMAVILIVFVALAATYMYSSRVDPVRPAEAAPPADSALSVRPPEATGVPSNEQPAATPRPDLLAGLTPALLAKVQGVADKQPCSCDCGMTVWKCYKSDPTCEHAPAELHAIIETVRGGSATPPTAK